MRFYVYVIHNTLNNKVYVGKTKNPTKRWNKHLTVARCKRQQEKFYIHRAIAKYGADNFTFSVIQYFITERECDLAEIYWVSYFQSKNNKYGYNLTIGGEGVSGRTVSEITRRKIRAKAIGRKHSYETLFMISGNNNHRAKLNWDKVKEIRRMFISKETLTSLSKKYNVSSRTIARVVYNVDWYDENYISPIPRKIKRNSRSK